MAKLKAHGAVLARATQERETPDNTMISYERTERTLHADLKVLENRTVIFRADNRRHSYGWKLRGKLKPNITPEAWVKNRQDQGWAVTHSPLISV
jgi:hypothetical protein